ncbi:MULTISPECIES: MFS transporter [Bacillales]|jgi:sugar phosphate permease|uniref:MFS transporter n=1 Tax=Brevibacillus TaxID=55080 RepID=UPI0014929626|nr:MULTISPECIES: MFS transporter [Bacillales]MBR8659532.1 MFS transporter [Brevibacillus sp. NL20B1]MDT3415074.1 sugar phosphate permease [Brevibacillus aydinogluensis]NNV01765.1 MFS transporter [Brevibacillus sp. MCWH]UFJ60865.1 MFS transporter [Anoxybacillus sediminis]
MPFLSPKAEHSLQARHNVRWTVVVWLLIGGIINYLDRANLSIAAPEMMKELGLSKTDIGLLGTVFSWSYALMQLPSGWLVDRFGAKKVYSIAVIWWSLATMMTGAVSKLSSLIGTRLLLGIGEAPCFPTAAKITSYWFPKKERGLATGIWDSSSKWGPAIAPPILVFLLISFGWRALFYITGLLGIVFVIFFLIFYKNPENSRKLSPEERAYIQSDGAGTEQGIQQSGIKWRTLFTYRSVWGMILGFFCTIWIWNIFLIFLPLYLVEVHHISLTELGIYASIPWIGGIFGNIFGGYLTKKLADKGIAEPMHAKRMLIGICALAAAAVVVIIPFVHGIGTTITLMTLAVCFISAITGSAWALAGDIAPPSMVASVGSIQNFGGYFGGAFSPVVAGMIVDTTGSYALAFISGGVIAGCAALCYWLLVKKPIGEKQA